MSPLRFIFLGRQRCSLMHLGVALLVLLAPPTVARADADLVIGSVTYPAGVTPLIAATNTITIASGATVIVPSGATVTYKAVARITLSAGFRASSGANFHAFIGDVAATPNPITTYALFVSHGSGGGPGLLPGSVRTITADAPPPGQAFVKWLVSVGPGSLADLTASTTTFTMDTGDAIVSAIFSSTNASDDSDGDGVTDVIEVALGLNPQDPTDTNVFHYTYDKVNQLKTGPGGDYSNKDEEGNIKEVKKP